MEKSSKKFSLNKADGKKLLTGLLIAVGGAVLTYAQDMIPFIDFGPYTPVVMAVNSVLINLARKWLGGQSL